MYFFVSLSAGKNNQNVDKLKDENCDVEAWDNRKNDKISSKATRCSKLVTRSCAKGLFWFDKTFFYEDGEVNWRNVGIGIGCVLVVMVSGYCIFSKAKSAKPSLDLVTPSQLLQTNTIALPSLGLRQQPKSGEPLPINTEAGSAMLKASNDVNVMTPPPSPVRKRSFEELFSGLVSGNLPSPLSVANAHSFNTVGLTPLTPHQEEKKEVIVAASSSASSQMPLDSESSVGFSSEFKDLLKHHMDTSNEDTIQ
jgi:hypothetical protein